MMQYVYMDAKESKNEEQRRALLAKWPVEPKPKEWQRPGQRKNELFLKRGRARK